MADCERLEREMEQFQSHISSEVDRVMTRTQFTIRGPRKPVTVDTLSPQTEESLLPPPLLPSNCLSVSSDNLDRFSNSGSPDLSIRDSEADPGPSLSTYIGFSAQSASIPSISCNTADTFLASPSPHSMAQSASSFTPSSTSSSSSLHSLVSPPLSPSNTQENKNNK